MIGLGTGTPRPSILGGGGAYSNKSLQLDKVDEYVDADTVVTDASTNTGTWLAWFNPSVTGLPSGSGGIISCGNSAANTYLWLANSATFGLSGACVNNGVVRWVVGADVNPFASDGWHLVGITHDGVEAQIYVDGVAIAQTYTNMSDKTVWVGDLTINQFSFGARRRNGVVDQFLGGKIDEVQLYNTALSAGDILDIYNAGCPKDESARASLYSYFRMGDGTGDNWNIDNPNEWTFIDQVGANNVFTVNCEQLDVLSSAPCLDTFTTKSLYLDGTNEYVNTDSLVASLSASTSGSWSLWIKFQDATPASNEFFITFGDTSANEYLAISQRTTGETRVVCKDLLISEWAFETNTQILQDNVWHNITLVQNGTSPVLYIDGVLYSVAEGNASWISNNDTTAWFTDLAGIDNGRVGCLDFNAGGNTAFTTANITDVQIYTTALSAAAALDIYNNGCPKDESARAGLVSYYRMGGGTGDNYNSGVANEWEFIDQVGTNDVFTDNCELDSVETDTPC